MNKHFVLVLLLLGSVSAFAQKQLFTAQDAAGNYKLYPRGISRLQWIEGTDLYTQMPKGDSMVVTDAATGKVTRSITLGQINAWLDAGQEELERFPNIKWHNKGFMISLATEQTVSSIDLDKGKGKIEIKLPRNYSKLDYIEHNGKWSYSYKYEGVLHANTSALHKKEDGFEYGETVHRSEFGITDGIFWSADGSHLAFYKNDQSAVRDYPMTNIDINEAKAAPIKYPMAGEDNEVVRLGVYSTKTGKIIYLETGDVDQYLTNITWGPAANYIYVGVLNRGQDHLKWQQYDAETGQLVKTLFEEKSESFVEPLHPLHFVPGKDKEFIWTSWRDGYTTLYHYSLTKGLIGNLLPGIKWEVKGLSGFSEDGKTVFFTGTGESPLETNLYSVSIKGGKPQRITGQAATHSAALSGTGKYVLDVYSSREIPRNTALLSAKGKTIKLLDEAADPLTEYESNTMEFFSIKADDNKTDLHCRIIKPYNFDPSKKYPTIVYVYGGSHAQMVTERWMGGASFFLHYLAHQGYIVFTLDNRGSDNRGRDFEQATFRQAGTIEIADQMKGVEWLKSQDYVDQERLGVHGWSYGGFMTTSLMLKQAETFKVGVCGGPVIDWKYYEIMYTERYMDTPEENPEGYKEASLLNHVSKLQGKLLIVHGTNDDVVVVQHTLAFIDQCTKEGVLFDYFPYPGGKHHWGGPARTHLMMKMAQYFEENL